MSEAVRIGVAGMGGYARLIIEKLLTYGGDGPGALTLVAACDPFEPNRRALAAAMGDAGGRVLEDFGQLLEQPIDAVWLPLPIDLHRSFAQQAFAAGKAVVCEKPIAGSIDDAAAMIAARDAANQAGLIGFQHVYHPENHALKRDLVAGRFGALESITIKALWPRDDRYYARSSWAARHQRNGRWVMDSPANNALAHPIHLCMFLAGKAYQEPAPAESVTAELYRANPIENYDTIAMRAELRGGVRLVVLLTHAAERLDGPVIDLRCTDGAVRIYQDQKIERLDADGRRIDTRPVDSSVPHMIRGVGRYLGGERSGIVGTFEMAAEHLRLLNAVSEATAVHDIPESSVRLTHNPDGGVLHVIRGIKAVFDRCAAERLLPHETGEAPWSLPAGSKTVSGYNHFSGPKTR